METLALNTRGERVVRLHLLLLSVAIRGLVLAPFNLSG
jgi:hypothetical protein